MALFIIVAMFTAWELKPVFFMFFVAYIINAALRPVVDWLELKKFPRILAIVLLYLAIFGVAGLFAMAIFSESFNQMANLLSQIPNIVYSVLTNLNSNLPIQSNLLNADVIKENLKEIVSSILKLDTSVFTTGINSALGIISYTATASIFGTMIIIISAYLVARKNDITHSMLRFVAFEAREKYDVLFKQIEERLGMWLRAQVFLMLCSATIVWVGLLIPALFVPGYTLHNYALPIAMLVFLMEILPGTGLTVGGILSTLIALASGNVFVILFVPLWFIMTQQMQAMFISPRVLKKALGLDPVITMLAVVAGYLLFNVLGAVLIIPLVAVIQIVLEFKAAEIESSIKKKIR
jgi:predicted PurR-regulated permease PerM